MHRDNSNGRCAARRFGALCAVLAMGLALAAESAEAEPFAYVANSGDNTVSVIDTATNTVVGIPIPWEGAILVSTSPRMGNTPMSRIGAPTMSR